jgi:hypothetical protein
MRFDGSRSYSAMVEPPHLVATAAGGHRAPAAASAGVEEQPCAATSGAAADALQAAGIPKQRDRVGGDGVADASWIPPGPVELVPVLAGQQGGVLDGLDVVAHQHVEVLAGGFPVLTDSGEKAVDGGP